MKLTDIRFGNGRRAAVCMALALAASLGLWGAANAIIVNMQATLSGTQEVPPNGSTATGSGTMVIDTDTNTMNFNISFSGLSAPQTAAHFHGPAMPGVNAGVIFGLGLGSPQIGVWNMTDEQEGWVLAGLTYVNVHTTAFPGGEIRGQVVEGPNATDVTSWGKVKALYR
jgi:CHRD domain